MSKKQAFTILELIITILILAILGTIAFMSIQSYSENARDSRRVSDMSSIKTVLELFQLDAGDYPQPTEAVSITYSGATVWKQGIFGESVKTNLSRLNKIPIDPLTEKPYTYSVLAIGKQYQLGGIVEIDNIAFANSRKVDAALAVTKAYITGNYNGEMAKVFIGTNCNVLALPSIITNDTSFTDLQQIISSGSLVYDGFNNLPASFKGSKFKYNGGFAFQPNKLIAYSDTQNCELLKDKTSYAARVDLLKGLQDAYSGTILESQGEIKNIIDLQIRLANLSQSVVNYADAFTNKNLGGKLEIGAVKVSYSECPSGTKDGYNYGNLTHYQTMSVSKSSSISNGTTAYGADALCNNGIVSIQNELTNIVCNSGYVEQNGACVQELCGNTVPTNAHSTATSQNAGQNWTHNTHPGVCTFICDSNYTWNGSSCIANTQNTSCTGLADNSVWNTASSITQTWSGTNWLPIETGNYNTTSSTTECRYKCNSISTWDGDSCELSCSAGTSSGYSYGALTHNQTSIVTKTVSITNGSINYGATATCTSGIVTISQESDNIVCNSGYVEQGGACVADVCGGSVPANAHSTATSQTIAQNWTYNTTPGTCTFACDINYTWNGNSCVANTQNTSCSGLPSNAVWNSASSITQTWNGTTWTPSETGTYNTIASTTTCNYKCDSSSIWDGTSCKLNCSAGTTSGYNYGAQNHNQTVIVTKSVSIPNGTTNYTADALCLNGTINIQNESSTITCNSGYVEQGGACVADVCGGSVPSNAYSTATSQTITQNWHQSGTAGVCTFACDTNYTWNGSSCVADTKSTSCTSLPSNASWNTASIITQTWSGTNWLPTEVGGYNTTASTTTCNYKCNTNYTWNGSSCVANTQSVSCGGSIPANATATTGTTYTQTWNGSAWSPTTSWGENQATCDFNCNANYSWDGSSCNSIVTTYPGCTMTDITVGTYTIAACNIGAIRTGITSSSYGNYFQWGNNGGTPSGTITPSTTLVNASSYGPGNYYNNTAFIGGASLATPYDWTSPQNNNLWGDTTNTPAARQGPCASGYHVPSQAEWLGIVTAGGWGNNGTNMMNALNLPMAGLRGWNNGAMSQQASYGNYWSSSPNGSLGYHLTFNSTGIAPSGNSYRVFGFNIRCFKN